MIPRYNIVADGIRAIKIQIAQRLPTIKDKMSGPSRAETLYGVVHEIFEARVQAFGGHVAVIWEGREVTYAELDQRANQFAHFLRGRGIGRGSLVGILLPRSLDAYIAILGTLKTGAAYVPIDPDYPNDRIAFILENSRATALVTNSIISLVSDVFKGTVVIVDSERGAIANQSTTRLDPAIVGIGPGDLCYVIYTSGSTGRPKGVEIEHRNLCNLIMAEGEEFQVTPTDRVCQQASLSFDLSVEEMWLAFGAGAALVPAPSNILHNGPGLGRFLADHQVTVLSCVPTLLTILDGEAPSLRLLILGGETCPETLVARWLRPGLRLVNSYGPTETTVTATCCDLEVGKPVTIGRPLPGYYIRLLDDQQRPVQQGQVGEICIGGEGVGRGYVGLLEETRRAFVPDQYVVEEDSRIYRTGDLGRFDAEGNLEFHGRRDGQVKLRGFRIELGEIESSLINCEGVLAAACAVREDTPGLQQLVGYVVPRAGIALDSERLRHSLKSKLPMFMIPGLIEEVSTLPRFPSGKLDRKSLPDPKGRPSQRRRGLRPPLTESEKKVLDVWSHLFQPQEVSVNDDFFLELGGHSLLAARMVSELRKDPAFSRVSLVDVYENPTVAGLASKLDSSVQRTEIRQTRESASQKSTKQHGNLGAGLVQTLLLYFVYGLRAIEWMTPYLVFFGLLSLGHSVVTSFVWAAIGAGAVFPVLLVTVVAAKWLLIGRVRPGSYPLWGRYYLRWWFVQALVSSIPLDYLAGTPLLPFVYRLFGAKIGRNVQLATENLGSFDQLSIGDNSSIDDDAALLCYTVKQGQLIIGPTTIGRDCHVGARSVLREETVMEDGARLEDLSLLQPGATIPHGETWAGSPARRTTNLNPPLPPPPKSTLIRRTLLPVAYFFLVLIMPVLLLAAVIPGVVLLTRIGLLSALFFLAVPLVGASFVLLVMVEVLAIKWLLVGRIQPGTYKVHGGFYVRNWVVEQLHSLSLDLIAPVRATLYLARWYRALGAKLGKFVELSTATTTNPDLLEIGDEATIADEASVGSARVEQGWMTVAPTKIGRRAFVGNSAVVPGGVSVGDGALIGVLSTTPAKLDLAAQPRTSWLGSPPVQLPRREQSIRFPDERTYRPTRKARLVRGSIESLRITLPAAGFVLITTVVVEAMLSLSEYLGIIRALLLLPLVYAGACAAFALALVALKWSVMGRFRAFVHPLWTTFIWRLEMVNALYEFLVTPLALDALQGTPLLPGYWRLLGAKIGRGVYAHTTGLIEFDLVKVGDGAALNQDCVLQTHLFEDRILKGSPLRIGNDCDIGAYSIVLYDSTMEDGAHLDALSLLMKGETLPANTAWAGVPARRSE